MFFIITFDWEEIQTWQWFYCVCYIKTHRLMCNITCLGQLGSSRDLDLKSNFLIDLSRSNYKWFDVPWQEKHNGAKKSPSYLSYGVNSYLRKTFFFEKKMRSFLPRWPLESKPLTSPQIWWKITLTGLLHGYLILFVDLFYLSWFSR